MSAKLTLADPRRTNAHGTRESPVCRMPVAARQKPPQTPCLTQPRDSSVCLAELFGTSGNTLGYVGQHRSTGQFNARCRMDADRPVRFGGIESSAPEQAQAGGTDDHYRT